MELRLAFNADKATAEAVREVVPAAVLRGGICRLKIQGSDPREVADRAREVFDRIRESSGSSKGFNRPERPQAED